MFTSAVGAYLSKAPLRDSLRPYSQMLDYAVIQKFSSLQLHL